MPGSTLIPVLTLPQPLVLLPTARLQVFLDEQAGLKLVQLVQRSDAQLVIGTALCTSTSEIFSWGTGARVVRVVRTVSRSLDKAYQVTLHGLSRLHYPDTQSGAPFSPSDVVELRADRPKDEGPASHEAVATFRAAATKLLDHLAQDANHQSRRDVYVKISHMLEEVSDDRTPWMADVIVAGINKLDYNDKLGESQVVQTCAAGPCVRALCPSCAVGFVQPSAVFWRSCPDVAHRPRLRALALQDAL